MGRKFYGRELCLLRKKVGVFTGSHLDNSVCDNCYFSFVGYVEEIKNVSTVEDVETKFINTTRIVNERDFFEEGKKYNLIHV